jgi:hypothetical protein
MVANKSVDASLGHVLPTPKTTQVNTDDSLTDIKNLLSALLKKLEPASPSITPKGTEPANPIDVNNNRPETTPDTDNKNECKGRLPVNNEDNGKAGIQPWIMEVGEPKTEPLVLTKYSREELFKMYHSGLGLLQEKEGNAKVKTPTLGPEFDNFYLRKKFIKNKLTLVQ